MRGKQFQEKGHADALPRGASPAFRPAPFAPDSRRLMRLSGCCFTLCDHGGLQVSVATRGSANVMARHELIFVAAAKDSSLSIFVRLRSTHLDSVVIILRW